MNREAERGSYRERSRRMHARKKQVRLQRMAITGFALLVAVTFLAIVKNGKAEHSEAYTTAVEQRKRVSFQTELTIDEQYLTPNSYSRPQTELKEVTDIVIHYVANPGSSAQANRDYFENLGKTGERYASSHFVIGIDGEIIQCIPLNEIAYASNEKNSESISIEVCHPEEDGKFTDKTMDALVQLTADLCKAYNLDEEHVIRHYDVTGKICPKYFVEHEDAWESFREDVKRKINAG